jgi:threonine dehydrogenase-like Zn-dependent dehydrogenase
MPKASDLLVAALELLRTGRLDLGSIVPRVLKLADLPDAMNASANAKSLECVIVGP